MIIGSSVVLGREGREIEQDLGKFIKYDACNGFCLNCLLCPHRQRLNSLYVCVRARARVCASDTSGTAADASQMFERVRKLLICHQVTLAHLPATCQTCGGQSPFNSFNSFNCTLRKLMFPPPPLGGGGEGAWGRGSKPRQRFFF